MNTNCGNPHEAAENVGLKAIGESAHANQHNYDFTDVDSSLLESFTRPEVEGSNATFPLSLHIEVPEFTSLCPITGQPDFAKIIIDYQPKGLCVESKSLKLYMNSFRNHKGFHEECVCRMAGDLMQLLDAQWLRVKGEFTPRGGIPFWPTVELGIEL